MDESETNTITLEGCPAANSRPSCPRCGGGWPGTLAKSEELTKKFNSGRLNPDKLGCWVIIEEVKRAVKMREENNRVADVMPDE